MLPTPSTGIRTRGGVEAGGGEVVWGWKYRWFGMVWYSDESELNQWRSLP